MLFRRIDLNLLVDDPDLLGSWSCAWYLRLKILRYLATCLKNGWSAISDGQMQPAVSSPIDQQEITAPLKVKSEVGCKSVTQAGLSREFG